MTGDQGLLLSALFTCIRVCADKRASSDCSLILEKRVKKPEECSLVSSVLVCYEMDGLYLLSWRMTKCDLYVLGRPRDNHTFRRFFATSYDLDSSCTYSPPCFLEGYFGEVLKILAQASRTLEPESSVSLQPLNPTLPHSYVSYL